MPPINVYTDAPIRPEHPTAITPQTAEANKEPSTQNSFSPSRVFAPASTTAVASSHNPPPPQPGARPTPTVPVYQASDPPPPQPGAVPVVTEYHTTTFTSQAQTPHQLSIPPPTQSNLQTRSTLTSDQEQSSHMRSQSLSQQPTPYTAFPYHNVDMRRHSLEHPPNYTQNQYENDRAAGREWKQPFVGEEWSNRGNEWWKVAKGWVEGAGDKLAEAEKEVWRWAKGK